MWIPHLDLGAPFLADPGNSALYPLNLILLLPAPACYGQFLVAHDALASIGAYLLLRQLALRPASAAFGALSFGLSGYLLCMMSHSGLYIMAIAWMPLVSALALRMTEQRTPSDLALFGLAFGCQVLTGEFQGCLLTAILSGCLVLSSSKRKIGAIGWLVAGGLIGTLVALPQIVSAVALLPLTTRHGGILDHEIAYLPLHPQRTAEMLVSGIWGIATNTAKFMVNTAVRESGAVIESAPWTSSVYSGSLCLVFAVFGLTRIRRTGPRWVVAVWLLGILMLLISFGTYTPLYGGFRSLVPVARYFRYPAKYFSLVALCVAMAGAYGVECLFKALSDRNRDHLLQPLIIWGGFGAAVMAGALVLPRFADTLQVRLSPLLVEEAEDIIRSACLLEGSLLLVLGMVFYLVLRKRPSWLGATLTTMLYVQLILVNHAVPLTVGSELYTERPLLAEAVDAGTDAGEPSRIFVARTSPVIHSGCLSSDDEREEALWRAISLAENTGILHGIGYAGAYSASRIRDRVFFFERNLDLQRRILELLSVRHFVIPPAIGDISQEGLSRILRDRYPCLMIYRGTRRVPVAHAVRGVIPAVGLADAVKKVRLEAVLNGEMAVIEGGAVDIDTSVASTSSGACVSKQQLGATFETRCRLRERSWVVVNIGFHPGWKATVNGAPARLFRANGLVAALQVPSGVSDIALEYKEQNLAAWLAALVCVGAIIATFRRRRSWSAVRVARKNGPP